MVKNHKKIWAHYEQLKSIIGYYITLFCLLPLVLCGLSMLACGEIINTGEWVIIKPALIRGLKWYAISMLIITILFIVWFLCYTDTVLFSDTSIDYYRWIFSKEARRIPYNEITHCVFKADLWKHNGQYKRGRLILIYQKKDLLLKVELYYKICQEISRVLPARKIGLTNKAYKLSTLDNYFKVDFKSLSYEDQLIVLKYYCKLMRSEHKTAEEILNMKISKKIK